MELVPGTVSLAKNLQLPSFHGPQGGGVGVEPTASYLAKWTLVKQDLDFVLIEISKVLSPLPEKLLFAVDLG